MTEPIKPVDRTSPAFLESRRAANKLQLIEQIKEQGAMAAIEQWQAAHPNEPIDLSGASLENADLRFANLDGANLYGANCQGARFDGASMRLACFISANLEGAVFDDVADIRGANFYHANGLSVELQTKIVEALQGSWSNDRITGNSRPETVRYDVTFKRSK